MDQAFTVPTERKVESHAMKNKDGRRSVHPRKRAARCIFRDWFQPLPALPVNPGGGVGIPVLPHGSFIASRM
jgi:hypothetical protein